jgi:rhodanese-related sulfurtransferase
MKASKWVFMGVLALVFFVNPLGAEELSPEAVQGAGTVDTEQAKQLFDEGAAFVDVRKVGEWDAGRIPGAIHLDLKTAFNETALAEEVQKDAPVVFYCNGAKCPRSAKACEKALGWGWTKVYYYRDGYPAWKTAALPVE